MHCLLALILLGTPAQDKLKNPYYGDRSSPPWKLWVEDDTPVGFAPEPPRKGAGTFAPPAAAERLYPDPSAGPLKPFEFHPLKPFPSDPPTAGWWDDAVASLDENHVNLADRYRAGKRTIPLKGQFIKVLYGSPRFDDRCRLGINFTWQSLARRGHHLVDEERDIRVMEEKFTFANCLYSSPGWISRTDVMADRMVDSYDGLFGHSYNSIGPSGSERHAIFKMLYAGAHLPRKTKDLMKRHGVYPLVMLTIFKAALPYADGAGNEVPWANELRHRPSYSSNGNTVPRIYAHRELEYHLYDEQAHLFRMVRMARAMDTPPPVTLLRVAGLGVPKDRLKTAALTSLRIHGKPGERLEVTVDLGRSYDLTGRPLTYHAERVYPEQKNIEIKSTGDGAYRITATHAPKLPRGRFPVILWVENGTACPGNPVFVNFHWPQPGQLEKPPYFVPYEVPDVSKEYIGKFLGRGGVRDPRAEVTRNLKPNVTTSLRGGTAQASVGRPVEFTLKGSDPEGNDTRFYLWSTGVGRIEGNLFRYVPKENVKGRTIPVRIICSDGTGAYRGLTVRIQIP